MKKPIIILLATLLGGMTARADVLTPAQALQRLCNESAARSAGVRKAAARIQAADATPLRVVSNYGSEPELYIFAPDGDTMLLLSAESDSPALLGYCDASAEALTEGALPPALEYMLNCYAEEINAVRRGNVIYDLSSRADDEDDFEPIPVVCPTLWNQDSPYWDASPLQENGTPYVTGCVATAMAQVLYTHKYPARCSGGEYTYTWAEKNEPLTLNFDDIELDWDNMLADYSNGAGSETERAAVATLIRAVGHSCNMNYAAGGSGALGANLAAGLVKFFDYETTTAYYQRRWYTLRQWQKMIHDELARGYAVYMDGQTGVVDVSAHAFMIDGYEGNGLFHVNWGWGGISNGYFLLTTMSPSVHGIGGASEPAGYCAAQGVILGMNHGRTGDIDDMPPRFYVTEALRASVKSATLGSSVSFVVDNSSGYFHIDAISTSQISAAVKFTRADGSTYYAREASQHNNMGFLYGMWGPTVTIPDDLPEGDYTISPAVYSHRLESYFDVYTCVGQGCTFSANVSGDTITFDAPQQAELQLEINDEVGRISVDSAFNLNCSITNVSEQHYDGYINAWLVKPGATAKRADVNRFYVNVAPGQTIEATARLTLSDKTVPSGTYELVFVDQNSSDFISTPVEVTVRAQIDAAELTAVNIECTDNGADNLTFLLTLKATDGNFIGKPMVEIIRSSESVQTLTTKSRLYIDYGETAQATVSGVFTGELNKVHTAYVYYTRGGEKVKAEGEVRARFIPTESSAIDELAADPADDSNITYYDLSGRIVSNPSSGLYIMRRGTSTTKVIL